MSAAAIGFIIVIVLSIYLIYADIMRSYSPPQPTDNDEQTRRSQSAVDAAKKAAVDAAKLAQDAERHRQEDIARRAREWDKAVREGAAADAAQARAGHDTAKINAARQRAADEGARAERERFAAYYAQFQAAQRQYYDSYQTAWQPNANAWDAQQQATYQQQQAAANAHTYQRPIVRPEWAIVLELPAQTTRHDVDAAYRRLTKVSHPDTAGGSHDKMIRLNKAVAEARKALCH